MYAIKLAFQGRSFFFYKGQDFLPEGESRRLFQRRSEAAGLVAQRFPGAKVVPVETRPALYRIRMKDSSHYLSTYDGVGFGYQPYYFQAGKVGAETFTREQALALVGNYVGAVIVPAV